MDPFTVTNASSEKAQGTENPSFLPEAFDKDMDESFTDENKTDTEDTVHKTFNKTTKSAMPSSDSVRRRRTIPLLLIYATVGLFAVFTFTLYQVILCFRDPGKKALKEIVMMLGLIYGQMGPVLPDLQKISGVDLGKASWIFTGHATGILIGCIVGGILFGKFNPYLLLFLYTIGVAATTALLPWIPELAIMVILQVGTGFGIGGQDTGAHTMLLNIWGDQGGRFIHMTHVLIAVGALLSPLITEPFLLPGPTESVVQHNINETAGVNNDSVGINKTNITVVTINPSQDPESTVHYALLITATVTAAAAFPSLYIYFADKIIMIKPKETDKEETRDALPSNMKITIIGVFCVNSFLLTACIDSFSIFLTTFLIEQLNWAQRTGAILTSISFGNYGLSNLIAASIHSYVQTTTLIVLAYVTTLATLLTLLLSVVFIQTVLIWVSVSFIGFTSAVLLPTLLTWIHEKITPVTGTVASAILFSGSAGVIVNPLLLGYLMDNITPMWFLYLSLGEILLCAVLFAFALGLSWTYSRPIKSNTLNIEFKTDIRVTVYATNTGNCSSQQSRLDIVRL